VGRSPRLTNDTTVLLVHQKSTHSTYEFVDATPYSANSPNGLR
jgi:hypothetical protein